MLMTPGWVEQGVELPNGALLRRLCDKGPIGISHLESRSHIQNVQHMFEDREVPAPVPWELELRGISFGSMDHPRVLPAEYHCRGCYTGPFQTLEAARSHTVGARHLRRARHEAARNWFDQQMAMKQMLSQAHRKSGGAPAVGAAALPDTPAGGEEKQLYLLEEWELLLPGYVSVWNWSLWWSLCTTKAGTLQSMLHHRLGQKHSKACQESGRPELAFVETKQLFEELTAGHPVCRKNDNFEEFDPPAQRSSRGTGGLLHAEMTIERNQPEDEPPAQVTPKDAATPQAWANRSGRAGTPTRSWERSLSTKTLSASWASEVPLPEERRPPAAAVVGDVLRVVRRVTEEVSVALGFAPSMYLQPLKEGEVVLGEDANEGWTRARHHWSVTSAEGGQLSLAAVTGG